MLASKSSQLNDTTGRRREPSTFRHFRRLLGYVWPHKRYLVPAVVCIFFLAFSYSASIGSILPVLTVLVKPQGLHGWVDQYIAEQRLKCELDIYDVFRHAKMEDIPDATAMIKGLQKNSPLSANHILHAGDFILAVNGVEGDAVDIFRQFSQATDRMTIKYHNAKSKKTDAVVLAVPPLTRKLALMRMGIGLVPGGRSIQERWWTLLTVLSLLIGMVLISCITGITAEYLMCVINCRAIIDLRRQMYRHVLNLPLSHFSQSTSETMSKFVQDMQDIFRGLVNFFQKVVTEPFKALGAVALALALNWKLTLTLMLGTPLAMVIFRKLGKIVRRANIKLLSGYGQMLSQLESSLAGMRVVKAYTRENHERKRLFKIDRHLLRQELKMGFIEAMTSPTIELFAFAGVAGTILYFAMDILNEPDRTPEFMTMLICLGAVFDPIRKLSSVYPKLQRANAAAQRVFELIDSPSEYEQDANRPPLQSIRQGIVFENVTFTYPTGTKPAVQDFSLTVRKGETLAIVGPNGSGKTTLLSLLPRFFNTDSGRILIDGQDIGQVTLQSLRHQLSIITQESVIFPDTVAANIEYGKAGAGMDEIQAAAQKAFADEFIRQMPQGYDTQLGEHGATLSGGQRQRIAIARAILRDAPILIFDEATSQVDPESEMKIHQALEAFLKNRTAFIIAHRFSTIAGADRIAVMDQGKLVAAGTHGELISGCPLYQRLYETQFRESQ